MALQGRAPAPDSLTASTTRDAPASAGNPNQFSRLHGVPAGTSRLVSLCLSRSPSLCLSRSPVSLGRGVPAAVEERGHSVPVVLSARPGGDPFEGGGGPCEPWLA